MVAIIKQKQKYPITLYNTTVYLYKIYVTSPFVCTWQLHHFVFIQDGDQFKNIVWIEISNQQMSKTETKVPF